MISSRRHYVTAALLLGLTLAACKPQETATAETPIAPPSNVETAPASTAPAATVTVSGIELGTALGADGKIAAPTTTFAPADTIIVAIATATSDPAASVAGKIGAKWSFQDGTVLNDESKQATFTGTGATDFRVANPAGWPVGKYKVEVSLDGKAVQERAFEIK